MVCRAACALPMAMVNCLRRAAIGPGHTEPMARRRVTPRRERSMSELQTQFETAAQEVQQLSRKPDDQTLLKLYALYKQATMGDVQGSRPGFMDMAGRFKYDAWAKLKGMSTDQAMQGYVDLVEQLKVKYK
jgi:acyl-CoA-binding protein